MKKTKKGFLYGLSFALVCTMLPTADVSAAKRPVLSQKKMTIQVGKSKILKVTNTTKKVKWKVVSGKTKIALKKKSKVSVTIKGIKKGTAKIRAIIGKKKLNCKIMVTDKKTEQVQPVQTPEITQISETPAKTPSVENAVTPTPASTPKLPTSTPTQTPVATADPNDTLTEDGKNKADVEALKALIAEQNAQGASVDDDIDDEYEYIWKEGRLVGILWGTEEEGNQFNLTSDLSFAAFDALEDLRVNSNGVQSLDVSQNKNLLQLECGGNQLTKLDLTNNTKLEYLYCYSNKLTELDVTHNVNLVELVCSSNQLGELDVSCNKELEQLNCSGNLLKDLDLTTNSKLEKLSCDDGVTVKGYNPPAKNEADVTALKALIVEQKEQGAIIDEDLDSGIYQWKGGKLISISWTAVGLKGNISFSALQNLKQLYIAENQITSIDVKSNNNLESLYCDYNFDLTKLDVSGCGNLKNLYCSDSGLSELNVSDCSNLEYLYCGGNQLTSLNVMSNVKLTNLGCNDNNLKELNVTNNKELVYLNCSSNFSLKELDVTNNEKLKNLSYSSNVMVTGYNPPAKNESDVNALKALIAKLREQGSAVAEDINCDQYYWEKGRLTSISWGNLGIKGELSFTPFEKLDSLFINDNEITSIDISDNVNLYCLQCTGNQITDLDVTHCTELSRLFCKNNKLSMIDISQNAQLKYFEHDENVSIKK